MCPRPPRRGERRHSQARPYAARSSWTPRNSAIPLGSEGPAVRVQPRTETTSWALEGGPACPTSRDATWDGGTKASFVH